MLIGNIAQLRTTEVNPFIEGYRTEPAFKSKLVWPQMPALPTMRVSLRFVQADRASLLVLQTSADIL